MRKMRWGVISAPAGQRAFLIPPRLGPPPAVSRTLLSQVTHALVGSSSTTLQCDCRRRVDNPALHSHFGQVQFVWVNVLVVTHCLAVSACISTCPLAHETRAADGKQPEHQQPTGQGVQVRDPNGLTGESSEEAAGGHTTFSTLASHALFPLINPKSRCCLLCEAGVLVSV
jgi:hypothetical protein